MARDGVSDAQSLDLARLGARFAGRELTAAALVEDVLARIAAAGDDKVWISRVAPDVLRARAAVLDARLSADPAALAALPLFGVPFAVKDNIDVAGCLTTAACPAFAYEAQSSAPAVDRLVEAGAILVGKTNLDQFATGLVGTRSPYGVPRNPFNPAYIPGGSSSGSGVAVAAGLVSFALGTDTAGSGRVPAAFNNVVGLKPSRGVVSTRGVVPACRSLDCVSVFALTAEDAAQVLALCASYDPADPLARPMPPAAAAFPRPFRFALPRPGDREFFGDSEHPVLFTRAVAVLESLGGTAVPVDFAPFRAAADLLYGGPWLAERLVAAGPLLERDPGALWPATRAVLEGAGEYRAIDAFRAFYRLAELRREVEAVWQRAELLLVPTAPSIYTLAEVAAEPLVLNTRLGRYTNFANLLDLAAIAVPAGFRGDGLPFGVTFFAPAFGDAALAELAGAFHRRLGLTLGATPHGLPPVAAAAGGGQASGAIHVAVAGAHLSGMPLNGRLLALGARRLAAVLTAPVYRMVLLAPAPARPGLVRVGGGGHSFEVEIWSMSAAAFGTFVDEVPEPLAIGTLLLADGGRVKGFLCEAAAAQGAEDISAFGGWRRFVAARG